MKFLSLAAVLFGLTMLIVSLTQPWLIGSLQGTGEEFDTYRWAGPRVLVVSLLGSVAVGTFVGAVLSRRSAAVLFGIVGVAALAAVVMVDAHPGLPSWANSALPLLGVRPDVRLGAGAWATVGAGLAFLVTAVSSLLERTE